VAAAAVVTVVGLGSTFLFKGGFEASEDLQARDKKLFNKGRQEEKKKSTKR